MGDEKNTILLTIFYQGEPHHIQTYPNQYYSLMTLISDKLAVPGFGLCCGMGSCGTCMVQLSNGYHAAKRTVLACDIRIDGALANSHIFMPDKIY